MLVTVCGYEQNPSRGVGEVVHTRFLDIRTDGWRSANLNAHPQVWGLKNNIQSTVIISIFFKSVQYLKEFELNESVNELTFLKCVYYTVLCIA